MAMPAAFPNVDLPPQSQRFGASLRCRFSERLTKLFGIAQAQIFELVKSVLVNNLSNR